MPARGKQMRAFSVMAGVAFILSGCATSHNGWTGSGAQPFDAALAECETKAAGVADANERHKMLELCMAEKGWTRPNR